jgi:outer membrane protein TolC
MHSTSKRAVGLALGTTLIAFVLAAGTPALAEEEVRSSWRWDPEAFELPPGEEPNMLALSLEDAIVLALRQNLGLQVQRFSRAQDVFRIQENRGIYDVNLNSTLFFSDETSPAASNLDGATVSQAQRDGFNLSLDRLMPTGGIATLDFRNTRFETNSLFATVNPSFTVDLDVVYQQPLLRNLGREATERNLLVAKTNSAISAYDLEVAVRQLIVDVENAYWTLLEARAEVDVAEESLSLAEELHQMNRVQVEVGTLAPLELVQSEAGIASRREAIIRARADVQNAEDAIRQLLNLDVSAWDIGLMPTTEADTTPIAVDLEAALANAFSERPEMTIQKLVVDNLELDSRVLRNLKRPALDLELRYGYNGLGGDVLIPGDPGDPTAPPAGVIPGGWGDAWDQIVDRDFDGWQAGLQFRYPIQNRSARARSTIADLAVEQGYTQLDEVELQIRTEVRRAAREVETSLEQIEAAQASMRLQEENVEAEQKRYENGLSTSFEVLRIQEDLATARRALVRAIALYRRALVAYWAAQGRLLEQKGIELFDDTEYEELKP